MMWTHDGHALLKPEPLSVLSFCKPLFQQPTVWTDAHPSTDQSPIIQTAPTINRTLHICPWFTCQPA